MLVIHDWEDEAYYRNLGNEKWLTRWGWEFLRRNPEYQSEYHQFTEFPDYNEANPKNGKWRGSVWSGARFYVDAFHYTNPPAHKGETLEEYWTRCPDCEIFPFREYLEQKYHFQPQPKDPERELTDGEFWFSDLNNGSIFGGDSPPWHVELYPDFESFSGTSYYEDYKAHYLQAMKERGGHAEVCCLAFDVRRPIDEQLKVAKELLLMERERFERLQWSDVDALPVIKKPKLLLQKWSLYIRILDAMSAGITGRLALAKNFYLGEENSDNNNRKKKLSYISKLRSNYVM